MKKNILILGGNGFIGKNLIEELVDDYNIISFGLGNKFDDSDNTKFYEGDFTSIKDLEVVFKENSIDLVFHLISTTVPSTSNDDMTYDINSNLIATIKLLNLMKKYTVPKIIFISSGGAIYGTIEPKLTSVSEDYNTNPISSYGIVKLSIEKYLYLYKYLYNIDYLILRLSNPYGENHVSTKQGLINIVLKNIIDKKEITVWGDGNIIRDYIYIKDCVKIISKLIKKNIKNQVIHIGSGQGYSINEILSIIKKNIGDFNVKKEKVRNSDVPRIVLNIQKLQSLIDFELTNIEKGIIKTYQWIKNQ